MTLLFVLACHLPMPVAAPPPRSPSTDWLAETSATEMRAKLARGELTPEALRAATLERIRALDPSLGSLILVDGAAVAGTGALAGLPIVLKDNIDALGAPTTAGSLALSRNFPPDDAFLTARLRAAGAVIIGKANLSEWANLRGDRSTSGWSGVGGQTHNPYVLDRNPCGSSSGSAVAVSAGLAALAVGTETDGSILCPASINGIVGVKPTLGLVSRDGIVPLSHSQDTAGPMARTVADTALLLEVLAAADPGDPAAAARPPGLDTRYGAGLRVGALTGRRLGVARDLARVDPKTAAVFVAAVVDLQRLGAVVVDIPLSTSNDVDACEEEVVFHDYAPDMAAYLANVDPALGVRSIADVVAFNLAHPEELAWFGQEALDKAVSHPRDDDYAVKRAECRRLTGPDGIDAALRAASLDAIVTPTVGPAWVTDPVHGDPHLWATSTITAVSGYPAVTVPMGAVHGLPVGITFLGAAFDEADLLAFAYDYEQGTHHRTAPNFRPTLDTPAKRPLR